VETLRRQQRIVAGSFTLAMLVPAGAGAIDSPLNETFDRTGHVMRMPPVRYLDSMRWMDWKPSAPVFKVDTLLLPDSTQPGVFHLPSNFEPDLRRVS
jgi:hypothetical protein